MAWHIEFVKKAYTSQMEMHQVLTESVIYSTPGSPANVYEGSDRSESLPCAAETANLLGKVCQCRSIQACAELCRVREIRLDSVPERFLPSEQIAFFSVVLRRTVAEQMVVVPTTKSRFSQQPPN
jgi:hypothetical protein